MRTTQPYVMSGVRAARLWTLASLVLLPLALSVIAFGSYLCFQVDLSALGGGAALNRLIVLLPIAGLIVLVGLLWILQTSRRLAKNTVYVMNADFSSAVEAVEAFLRSSGLDVHRRHSGADIEFRVGGTGTLKCFKVTGGCGIQADANILSTDADVLAKTATVCASQVKEAGFGAARWGALLCLLLVLGCVIYLAAIAPLQVPALVSSDKSPSKVETAPPPSPEIALPDFFLKVHGVTRPKDGNLVELHMLFVDTTHDPEIRFVTLEGVSLVTDTGPSPTVGRSFCTGTGVAHSIPLKFDAVLPKDAKSIKVINGKMQIWRATLYGHQEWSVEKSRIAPAAIRRDGGFTFQVESFEAGQDRGIAVIRTEWPAEQPGEPKLWPMLMIFAQLIMSDDSIVEGYSSESWKQRQWTFDDLKGRAVKKLNVRYVKELTSTLVPFELRDIPLP